MKKRWHFEIVAGIRPGYKNLKEKDSDKENIAANLWQANAEEAFEENGIFVTAVIKRSYTIYNEERGCPKGGERTVVISGTSGEEDFELWKGTVLKLGKKLKEQLGQEDMGCEFWQVEKYDL